MKVAAALLVCAITFARGQEVELNENGCPVDYTYEKLYAHEICNKFYQCRHGILVERRCAADLLFNVDKQECDWPHDTECGDRLIPGPESEEKSEEVEESQENGGDNPTCNCNPGEAPSICAGADLEGVLVAHENCNQFYKCSGGLPVAHTCDGDLLYNPHTEQCDWSNNVDCGNRVTPDREDSNQSNGDTSSEDDSNGENGGEENGNGDNNNTCNCNPGEAPTICADSDSEGILVAHENCNQFYKCSNNVPIALNCSGDLLYNPYTQQCDWPDNVDCGDRIIPECNDNGGDNGDNGSDENSNGDNGGEDNGNGDNNNTCNCNPGEAPTICAGSGSEGALIAHENCNQFYMCAHGSPVAQTCTGDLLYNPYTQQCDWPNNVDCGDRVIPDCEDNNDGNGENGSEDNSNGDNNGEDNGNGDNNNTCNCNPGEAPTICSGIGSDGVLIAHENCNQFYICSHGSPLAMTCFEDLLFNPYTNQCDWPNNVDCGDRVIPDCEDNDDGNGENGSEDNGNENNSSEDNNNGDNDNGDSGNGDNNNTCNCNPGEAPTICAGSGSEGTLIAHENCNQFYICTHGLPVAQTCSGDLLYNPYTQQCDWPNNVDCGDRVIPDCEDNNEGNGENGSEDNSNGDNNGEDNGNGDNNNTCNCNPGEAPTICSGIGSDGVLIAHENCNQFYICSHGSPLAMTCFGDLLFNPYTNQCDWPNNVDCGDRVIPDCEDNDDGNGENGSEDNGNENNSSEDNNNGDNDNGDSGNGDNNNTCNCNPGEAPTICAGSGSEGTLIAHENCNQFYICTHGLPVAQTCSGDLLYNPYTQQCDWPNNVDCGDRVIPDCEDNNEGNGENGSEDNSNGDNNGEDNGNGDNNNTCNCNPGEAPTICSGIGSDGVLIAHENCNQFYICSHGSPLAMTCFGDLLFNPYTNQCDWPNNVDCGDRVIPDCEDNDDGNGENGSEDNGNENNSSEDNNNGDNDNGDSGNEDNNNTCNCNPGEAPTICAGSGSEGTLIAHENCNQFYICTHGLPVAQTCSGDLLYNPYTQQCDWPNNVDCGERVIPDCEDNNDGNEDNVSESDGDNGSENNGNGDNGGGDNGSGDNNNTCNCNPGEAPTICAGEGSDGVLIAHENCNQFYQCANNINVALSCPGDLLYNPHTQQCDWPDNVDCGERIIPDCDDNNDGNGDNGSEDNGNGDNGSEDNNNGGGDNGSGDNNNTCNCNPGEAPTICAGEGSDGVLIAHENCNQFYQCANNINVALSCPGDLLYNPHTQQCDWPNNVDCGERIIPDCDDNNDGNGDNGSEDNGNGDNGSEDNNNGGGDNGSGDNNNTCNCNPGEAPTICAGEGSDGVLIAHGNCNQFYQCANNINVALSCPGDLLYNPHTQQCDWPDNVDCGERIIPDCEDNNDGNGDNGSEDNGNGENGSEGNNNGDNDGGDNGSGDNNNTCNCNPGEAPTICAGEGSDGVLIAHENCNQFYQCANNINVALSCPGDLLYNPHTQQCDWPDNVDCGERIIPDCDDNNDGNGDNGSEDNGNGENGSEDNNNGGGDNGSGDNNNTCNCNPSEAPAICAGSQSEGALIAHENCDQFFKCANNVPVALNCSGDLLYNPYTEQCDWPKDVDCGDRVIPDYYDNVGGNGDNDSIAGEVDKSEDESEECDDMKIPEICKTDGSDGVFVAHENCNQFYVCSDQKASVLDCPGMLLYDVVSHRCEWPALVDCGDRNVIEIEDNDTNNGGCNCNPLQAPVLCATAGSDGELIAHENCDQFYKCANSIPVPFSCTTGLLYNPYKQVCDWPNNVDCAGRPLSYFVSMNKHLDGRKMQLSNILSSEPEQG